MNGEVKSAQVEKSVCVFQKLISDYLKLKKLEDASVKCPEIKFRSNVDYNKDVETTIQKEQKAIDELRDAFKAEKDLTKKNKISAKIEAKESYVNDLKGGFSMSADEIDVSSFSFFKTNAIDPELRGIKAYLNDKQESYEPLSKDEFQKMYKGEKAFDELKSDEIKELMKKENAARKAKFTEEQQTIKHQEFKDLINSLGIIPLENKSKFLAKLINETIERTSLWKIKVFNSVFTHPNYEKSTDKKQYLLKYVPLMDQIIAGYNGKNRDVFLKKYLDNKRISHNEMEALENGTSECAQEIISDYNSIIKFIAYYDKHEKRDAEKEAYAKTIEQISQIKAKKWTTSMDVIQYYSDIVAQYNEIDSKFGSAFISEIQKTVPIRFGTKTRSLISGNEEAKAESIDVDNGLTSADKDIYNREIYAKAGKIYTHVNDEKNDRIAYGIRMLSQIMREIELISARHKSDNFTITIKF